MNHRIACSLCPHNLPGGRGVTLVRRFIVFNFCWSCYRNRRAECEAFMDKATAPVQRLQPKKRRLSLATAAVSMVLLAVAGLASITGCTRPHKAQPFTLRHCAVTSEANGLIRCDCPNPLVVWDAPSQRKVVYCDGVAQ